MKIALFSGNEVVAKVESDIHNDDRSVESILDLCKNFIQYDNDILLLIRRNQKTGIITYLEIDSYGNHIEKYILRLPNDYPENWPESELYSEDGIVL